MLFRMDNKSEWAWLVQNKWKDLSVCIVIVYLDISRTIDCSVNLYKKDTYDLGKMYVSVLRGRKKQLSTT